ncbi:hypothetical protein RCF27_09500 [Rhodococcus pyridinivorans]|uniref:hypothetical protein n=1 Tax=Rhodococcus pyridinivorans TaxID=103816 RepID=UPI00280A84D1|nr:hypothetical protein [Rhodococcus pyridinivorans]WMM74493.1 hypothetical protein RCF27_09500 [Rhodococcus pyridinivorans]
MADASKIAKARSAAGETKRRMSQAAMFSAVGELAYLRESITAASICRVAKVGSATFYGHFSSAEECAYKACDALLSNVADGIFHRLYMGLRSSLEYFAEYLTVFDLALIARVMDDDQRAAIVDQFNLILKQEIGFQLGDPIILPEAEEAVRSFSEIVVLGMAGAGRVDADDIMRVVSSWIRGGARTYKGRTIFTASVEAVSLDGDIETLPITPATEYR